LLCKRCRHAERERLRYHDDPQYRARRLAYSATRYQKTRESRRERVEHQTVEAGSDDR
jgi:hypothetical protein